MFGSPSFLFQLLTTNESTYKNSIYHDKKITNNINSQLWNHLSEQFLSISHTAYSSNNDNMNLPQLTPSIHISKIDYEQAVDTEIEVPNLIVPHTIAHALQILNKLFLSANKRSSQQSNLNTFHSDSYLRTMNTSDLDNYLLFTDEKKDSYFHQRITKSFSPSTLNSKPDSSEQQSAAIVLFKLLLAAFSMFTDILLPIILLPQCASSLFIFVSSFPYANIEGIPNAIQIDPSNNEVNNIFGENGMKLLLNLFNSQYHNDIDEQINHPKKINSSFIVAYVLTNIAQTLIANDNSNGFPLLMKEGFFRFYCNQIQSVPEVRLHISFIKTYIKGSYNSSSYIPISFNYHRLPEIVSTLLKVSESICDSQAKNTPTSNYSPKSVLTKYEHSTQNSETNVTPVLSQSYASLSSFASFLYAALQITSLSDLSSHSTSSMAEFISTPNTTDDSNSTFSNHYETYLIPIIFERYLVDIQNSKNLSSLFPNSIDPRPTVFTHQLTPSVRNVFFCIILRLIYNNANNTRLLVQLLAFVQEFENTRVFTSFHTSFYDHSHSSFKYLGIQNPGSLCYMIYMLHQLYMQPHFRKLILYQTFESANVVNNEIALKSHDHNCQKVNNPLLTDNNLSVTSVVLS